MQPSLSQVTHEKKGQNLWLIRENSWNDPSVPHSADKQNFPPCLQRTAPAAPSLAFIMFLPRTAETVHSSCETRITPSEEKTAHSFWCFKLFCSKFIVIPVLHNAWTGSMHSSIRLKILTELNTLNRKNIFESSISKHWNFSKSYWKQVFERVSSYNVFLNFKV